MKKIYAAPAAVASGDVRRDTKGGIFHWWEDGGHGWPEPGNAGFHL